MSGVTSVESDSGAVLDSQPVPSGSGGLSQQTDGKDERTPASSPSSFFTSSISSSDSAYHRIAVLLCPGCWYLEFPGCLVHNGLLANMKGNGYMSCVSCELDRKAQGGADVPGGSDNILSMVCATDTAEPWSVACQHCNQVKADTIPWIIADRESVGLAAAVELEKEDVMPHSVIQCEQCKTSVFPLSGGRLTRRHATDPARAIYHPDDPETPLPAESFPFQHYVADCRGALLTIPIMISKLEGKFCGQALPASPYLPLDSSFVPGFVPPIEWVTGDEHKAYKKKTELRQEKYVLSSLGHRTPVWRDKAYVGILGDPFVRDTELEGGHIAESVDAMHFILDALYKSSSSSSPSVDDGSARALPFDFSTASWFSTFAEAPTGRDALKRVIDTIGASLPTIHFAKDALDALVDKDMKDSEKLQFTYRLIRHWRRRLRQMQVGDVLILPGGWIAPKAGHAIMHIIYRYESSYSFVTSNTGGGLTYHPSSVADDGSKQLFRTSIRVDNIPPHRILDDGFWLLFWRLQTVQSDDHDHHVLYEILLPALGGKSLAESIVPNDPHAEWRTPQRAGTCYMKSVLECVRYLSRSFGMSKTQTKQSSFNVRRLLMNLCLTDLRAHQRSILAHPDSGDEQARRRRRAARLQSEMREEKIPEQKKKESSLSVSSPTDASSDPAPHEQDLPLVDILSENLSTETTPLHDDSDLTMIRLSTKQTAHAALKESKSSRLTAGQLREVLDEIQLVEQTITTMPIQVLTSDHVQPVLDMAALDDAAFSLDSPAAQSAVQQPTAIDTQSEPPSSATPSPFLFPGFDSFPLSLEPSTRDRLAVLAGKSDPVYVKKTTDFRRVLRPIHALDDILAVLDATLQLCIDIDAPRVDSLNGYYQVLSLIQGVLASIPLPGSSLPSASSWFTRSLTAAEQAQLVRTLWRLGRFYMSSELSIESPAFVSGAERTVCMWALVTIADWAMRRVPSGQPDASPVTQVLNGGDGLYPLYLVDLRNGGGVHVRDMVRDMECSSPGVAHLYGELVEYWSELETMGAASGLTVKHILPFSNSAAHQTAMFLEDDSTLNFVRDIAKAGGYIIEKRGYAGKESSEIEAVARWLFAAEEGDYSVGTASFSALIPQLARDHPEFAHFRDLHFLFKLALVQTHPTARVARPGRYTERDATIYWTTYGMPMSNDMVMIFAKAFSKKEILLIKSRRIDTYATPDAYLPASAKGSAAAATASNAGGLMGMVGGMGFGGFGGFGNSLMDLGSRGSAKQALDWSEEDIITNPTPALFDNLLSVQSSEQLMCALTAPYLRIPLVVSFFANKDRVDLLADRRLGRLFMCTLFEVGAWASRFHEEDVQDIPFEAAQPNSGASSRTAAPDAAVVGHSARIGSPYGLLLNELCSSAGATLNPFLRMITHALALDTGYFSVTSATCRLILFAARAATRMESFVRYTLEQIQQGAMSSASKVNTDFLMQAHSDLMYLLHGPILAILVSYKAHAMTVISDAVWVMSTIALVCASGLQVPSHLRQLSPSNAVADALTATTRRFSPSSPFSSASMVELLGSFSFVLTWHSMGIGIGKNLAEDDAQGTWSKATPGAAVSAQEMMEQFAETMQQNMNANKLKRAKLDDPKEQEKAMKQPVPEVELFRTLQNMRPDVLAWFEAANDGSIVGGVLDAMVEWVHGHKMADIDAASVTKQVEVSPVTSSQWQPMTDPDGQIISGRFVSHTRRLEVDLQTASITFYAHDVFPVHDLIARHDDFLTVFGSEPQHYALMRSSEHLQEYGIFGSTYTLQWWDRNLAGECVDLPAPAKVASEHNIHSPASTDSALPNGRWKCGSKGCAYVNSFSALRCELCHAYQPMLSGIEKFGLVYRGVEFTRRYGSTYLAPHESWIVELLEPLLRTVFGDELDELNYSLWMRSEMWPVDAKKVCLFALDAQTFKQVVLHRTSRLAECFNLVEHGRILYRSLVYTSNGRLSLSGLPVDDAPMRAKPWESLDRFATGSWEEVQKRQMSFTLRRVRRITPDTSVVESFISPSLLIGLLPRVLLEHFHFYLVEDIRRAADQNEFDWFSSGDILGFLQPAFHTHAQWNFDLHVKLVPNAAKPSDDSSSSSPSVTEWDRSHAIISQVRRGAAGPLDTSPASVTPVVSPSPSPLTSPSTSPNALPLSPLLSATTSAPFMSVLLHLSSASPSTFLARLASVMMRIEDLSHVLVWAKPNAAIDAKRDRRSGPEVQVAISSSTTDSYRITRIELPRLQLSFRPRRVTRPDGSIGWRLASNDHAGYFISDAASSSPDGTTDAGISALLRGLPNSILLENDRRQLSLFVPNTPLKRPQILSCPFSNELVADRANDEWMRTMPTRFYLYPVHASHTFLLTDTLGSTLYLLLTSLLSRQYILCARYCTTCAIDTTLTAEERFVFRMFEQTLHDQHPDAHAIRLKLYMCIWLSGEPVGWQTAQGQPWSLEEEYSGYCQKLMHVSAGCRLTNDEEEAIYQQISYEEGKKKENAPSVQQNRAAVRAAIVQHASSAAAAASDPSSTPARVPISLKPPKRDGLKTFWSEWESSLGQYFSSDWKPGLWSGMVCYERPSALECRDIDLLDTIGDVLGDTMIGSMHRKGFLFLLDAILGGVTIRVDSSDAACEDCAFTLGRLLTQFHFLKETKFGENVKPQPNYLPFAVNAVFSAGFIPMNHNRPWQRPVFSIPSFPPLPQVPYNGIEDRMTKGFLLHRSGTPVNQFFTMMSQWAAGFVRMCQEWQQYCVRPTIEREVTVKHGQAIVIQWPTGRPSDTACGEREIRPFDSIPVCSLDEETCASLVQCPLQSVGVSEFLVARTSNAATLTSLPFDVSRHPSAQTYVAKSMLARMESDMGAYAQQLADERSFQLKGVTTTDLQHIAGTLDAAGIDDAINNLSELRTRLVNLRARDWKLVQNLRCAIERLANAIPDLASEVASLPSLQFALERYAGQKFTVLIDYATTVLLSSRPTEDLRQLNPHLPAENIPDLLQLVSAMLLVNNRVGLIDRVLFEIDELRTQLQRLERKVQAARFVQPIVLVRSLSGGTTIQAHEEDQSLGTPLVTGPAVDADSELQELVHQIGIQSSTLADNLLSSRHYATASSGSIGAHTYDPRFLLFEYLENIMLRRMQVDLVQSFAAAAEKRTSLVQQMIMGAGKTTVVGPLLALMLADGASLVTLVVPSALLPMSRSVLRARFSSILAKSVSTFEYDRSTKDDPTHVAKIVYKLNQARTQRGIVVATAVSVKSLMLKYLELTVSLQTTDYDPRTLTDVESRQLVTKSVVIDGLSQILGMWHSGRLILDEIDLLLHPLKSELNFPCGAKVTLQPAPQRWNYPMHLIDCFFYAGTGYLSVGAFHELPEAQQILAQLQAAIKQGHASHMLQMMPHLILLNTTYYHDVLKPILAKWSLIWLKAQGVAAEVPDAILLEYMTSGWSSPDVSSLVTALLSKPQMVLLNLAHSWLNSFLVHVLAKVNRVSYGLLKEDEMQGEVSSFTRRLVAVPFLAKDVPSRSSEFAHSEVLIGLTVLAYRIEGMRVSDLRHLVSTLKNSLSQETGPEYARPSAKRFDEFVRQAKRLRRRQTNESKKEKSATSKLVQFAIDDSAIKILPLSQFSLTDPSQLRGLYSLVRDLPSIIDYYLSSYLFPACMFHHQYTLSASGADLGSGMLFSCAIGFSGTPSDLLPLALGRCVFERGSDGKVTSFLTSSQVVSHSIKHNWSVRSLLLDVARHQPPFHSLIDTGALITGMDNREVAEFLLEHGLESMDGVVYLDQRDQQMILLRTGGAPVPVSQCGVAPHKRFSFYDQIHTTGIDIKHSVNAVAVLTIGKDMTFRDYAQGAFRMRQIGQGQKIHLFVIPEVLKLIERELNLANASASTATDSLVSAADPSSLPTNVAAWLTINSMRMEQLQFFQSCMQNLHSVWRKKAFADLLADSTKPSEPNMQSRRHLRFDLSQNPSPHVFWLVECLNLFKQPISFEIEDHIPVHRPFFYTLKSMIAQNTTMIKEDAQCIAIGTVLTQALEAAQEILPTHAYDREMINEQEREQEQEKHQEVLRDPRAQRDEEEHLPWKIDRLRETQAVTPVSSRLIGSHEVRNTTGVHPFFPLAGLSLEGRPMPLVFPRYLMMSHNYFRQAWALNPKGHRRLKNISVLLEWCAPASTIVSGAGASAESDRRFLEPIQPTWSQSDRWRRLFRVLDVDGDGRLTGTEVESLRRVLSDMIDQDVPVSFFDDGCALGPEEVRRLLQATTKEQDPSKIAGFIASEQAATSVSTTSTATQLSSSSHLEEDGRFFVILPLSEAQSLRRAVHTTHPLFRKSTDVQFAIWSLDGHIIEATPHYQPPKHSSTDNSHGHYQRSLGIQTARFINGELYYTEEELVSLLRGLSGVHPSHRRTLLDQLLLCRHRDHRTVAKTPLERVLHFSDESQWFYLRALVVSFRQRIDSKGLSLLEAFHHFDLDGNGLLDADELWTALHFLGFGIDGDAAVKPNDAMELMRLADTGQDGAIDFEEFARAFRTREEMRHMHETMEREEEEEKETEKNQPSVQTSSSASASAAPTVALPKLDLLPMPALEPATPAPAYVAPSATIPTRASPPSTVPPSVPVASPSVWSPSLPASVPAASFPPLRSSALPLVVATHAWSCPACTFENAAGRSRCEICDTPMAR